MSSEASSEVVDIDLKLQVERSYYPSQQPVDSTDRVQSGSSHGPTECMSDVIRETEMPRVEELTKNLVIATDENQKLRTALEDCNTALTREVEAAEGRNQEMANLKAMLENYSDRNTQLEKSYKSLQEQISARPEPERWGYSQGVSQSTDEVDYSTNDAAATMREQIAERATEIEELRKLNNNLQESRSSLEHKYEQLKLEHQKMREDNTYQLQYPGARTRSEVQIDELQQGMEKMKLSQNAFNELEEDNRRLSIKIKSLEEENDKMQKQLSQHTLREFVEVPSNPAERIAHKNKLMNKLETLNIENEKLRKDMRDNQDEMTLLKQNNERFKKENSTLQEVLEKEKRESEQRTLTLSTSSSDLEMQNKKLATEKVKLEELHFQVSSDYSKMSEELEDAKRNLHAAHEELSQKQQELQSKESERLELLGSLEQSKMDNKQLNEQLSATSRNLDQALDSLRHNKQEHETISSRADDAYHQLQQEKEQFSHQLQDARVERDKLLEQLREAYSEKETIEGQFQMLNQNYLVLQNYEEEHKKEKEAMLKHMQQLDTNLQQSNQKLDETIREYQITVQDLETTVQRKLVLEGELAKLRGHYTQVNDERNQLKRTVDEKDNEIQKLVKEKTTLVKDHSDTMELMRNQIQQYARDYEDERVGRENLVKQIVKLEASNKEKDEEIDQLQDKLTKFTGIMIRPDIMGRSNSYANEKRSGEQRRPDMPEPREVNQRSDQWSGAHKQREKKPSESSQGSEDPFNSSYPPPTNTHRPVTTSFSQHDTTSNSNNRMFGDPYGNVPVAGGGGAGINIDQPRGSAYTDIHQLQQRPMNNYGQDRTNQPNRPGPPNMSELGDLNQSVRRPNTEMHPPPHQQPPANNFGGEAPLDPCPLCGKRFPTIEELFQHAALCNY